MLNILNSEIPPGGRFLTSSECRKLRKYYPAHSGLRVTRNNGLDYIGVIWRTSTLTLKVGSATVKNRTHTAVCRARFGGDE
jgi:hypothetical protein